QTELWENSDPQAPRAEPQVRLLHPSANSPAGWQSCGAIGTCQIVQVSHQGDRLEIAGTFSPVRAGPLGRSAFCPARCQSRDTAVGEPVEPGREPTLSAVTSLSAAAPRRVPSSTCRE